MEELEKYKPQLTKQPDFGEFWDNSLEELSKIPYNYKLEHYPYPVNGVKVYRISYIGFNNANIDGWLAMPDREGKHPGLVIYHGYNGAYDGKLHETVDWALRGYAALQMLCRGQHGNSVDNVISSTGGTTGWMTKGIQFPYEYYYRAVYMDAVRALEILASI